MSIVPKTNIQNNYFEKLAFVNDQLCYFQFADEEVQKSIGSLGLVDPNAMTTDLFPGNQYSVRIRVRYEGLLGFREKAINTSYGVSTALAVEHLLCYINDVLDLKVCISKVPILARKFDSPEEKLEAYLKHWGIVGLDPAVLKTLKHLRLRRNHLAHAREHLSEEFERHIRHEGHHLNSYWKSRTFLGGVDFSSSCVDKYSFPEAYECIKLIRACIQRIDGVIASSFVGNDLVRYMFNKLVSKDIQLRAKPKVLARKIRRRLIDDFSCSLKVADVDALVGGLLAAA